MCEIDERDDWLEGVRRWYFGGTPGPDDEAAAGAEVEPLQTAAASGRPSETTSAWPGRHA